MIAHGKKSGRLRTAVVLGAVLGLAGAGACSTASLTDREPCRGAGCSCEEDPSQALCKGFNERLEGGSTESSAPDAADAAEASDGGSDAPADGGDEAG
jgi:hypothetical protein